MNKWMLRLALSFWGSYTVFALSGCGAKATAVRGSDDEETSRRQSDKRAKDKAGRRDAKSSGARKGDGAGEKGEAFVFPKDRAGELLVEQLTPHRQAPPVANGFASGPRRPPEGLKLNRPPQSLPPSVADLPDTDPEPPVQPLRPHLVSADPPLEWADTTPRMPARKSLPSAARVRLPSPDIKQPLPPPALAQDVPDRASLTDPTGALSHAVALAAKMPARTSPAPFLRINLPDPFELREEVRVKRHIEEGGVPVNIGSQAPPK